MPTVASACEEPHSGLSPLPIELTLLLDPPQDPAEQWRWVRKQLAGRFGIDEGELTVEREAQGKPKIRGLGDSAPFSIARRPGLLLLGTGHADRIGVDLEILDPSLNWQEIAQSFFHPDEANVLAEMRSEEGIRGFTAAWAVKEAVLKAIGCGIGQGLVLPRIAKEVLCEIAHTDRTEIQAECSSASVEILRIDAEWVSGKFPGPLFVAAATIRTGTAGAEGLDVLRLRLRHRSLCHAESSVLLKLL